MLIQDAVKELLQAKYQIYCYELQDENFETFYVGISSRVNRLNEHLYFEDSNYMKQKKIKNTIARIGYLNVCIVAYFSDWENACEFEIERISEYGRVVDSTGTLSNLTLGGEGSLGSVGSLRQKEAASKANKGKILSEETKDKIRKSRGNIYSGKNASFYGKTHTEETREVMSIKASGENNPSHKRKGDEHFNKGRSHTEETKKKISIKKSKIPKDQNFKDSLKSYWKNQPELICPHCGKTSTFKAAMVKYHFENCKNK